MANLSCGNVTIPLVCVESISWAKRARVIQHIGGYISTRGFEAAEVSVKARYDAARLRAMGEDVETAYSDIFNLVTDRLSPSGVLYIADVPIYPDLEFTPTNINKTYMPEMAGGADIIEVDIVFSGVKASKEVSRDRLLEVDAPKDIPTVTISVDNQDLVIKDQFRVTEMVTTPTGIRLSVDLGDDSSVIDRDAFVTKLIDRGVIRCDLPTGSVSWYVVQADLVDEVLSVVGSVVSTRSQKNIVATYQNTSLRDVLEDLAARAGIECDCIVDGKVDYYRALGTPMECIRELQAGAGFITSWRRGVLTCAPVPESIAGAVELVYRDLTQDTETEAVTGIYWYDGINSFEYGDTDRRCIKINSMFRSQDDYSRSCFRLAVYNQNAIAMTVELMDNIDTHSAVFLQSNNEIVNGLVDWYEADWIANEMKLEIHYV